MLMDQLIDLFFRLDKVLNQVVERYDAWTYVILFAIIFCETGLVVTPILPGDSLLFAVGVFAAQPNSPLNIWILLPLLLAAAVLGDTVNYHIGKYLGPKVFSGKVSPWNRRIAFSNGTAERRSFWPVFCRSCEPLLLLSLA